MRDFNLTDYQAKKIGVTGYLLIKIRQGILSGISRFTHMIRFSRWSNLIYELDWEKKRHTIACKRRGWRK